MKKKLLALLLVAAMVLAILPSSIFAGDELQVKKSDGSAAVKGTDYEINYNQNPDTPIEVVLKADNLVLQGGTGAETVSVTFDSTNLIRKVTLKGANIKNVSIAGPNAIDHFMDFEIVSEDQNTIVDSVNAHYAIGILKFTGQGSLTTNGIVSSGDLNFKSGSYTCAGVDSSITAGSTTSENGGTISFEDGIKFYAAGERHLIEASKNIIGNNIYASADKLEAAAITTKGSVGKVNEATKMASMGVYTIFDGTAIAKSFAIGYVTEPEEEPEATPEKKDIIPAIKKTLKDESTPVTDIVEVLKASQSSGGVTTHTLQEEKQLSYGTGQVVLNTYVANDSGVKGIVTSGNVDVTKAIATEAELAVIEAGGKLNVLTTADTITPTDENEVAAIQREAGSRKVAYYIDFTMYKQLTDKNSNAGSKTEITSTNAPISVSVIVPEDVRNAYSNLKVVRYHDSKATLIEPESYDSATGELVFASSLFSDFAIVGTDNPNTGIGSSSGLWAVAALVVCAGTLVLISLKKRESVQ